MKSLTILILICLTSCVTYTRCYEKFGKQLGDSTRHEVTGKADIILKSDSTVGLVTLLELDSLKDGETLELFDFEKEIEAAPDAVVVKAPRKPKVFITKVGNDFKVKGLTVTDTIKVQVKVPCVCPPQIQFKDPKNGWVYFFSGLALGVFLYSILAYFLKIHG